MITRLNVLILSLLICLVVSVCIGGCGDDSTAQPTIGPTGPTGTQGATGATGPQGNPGATDPLTLRSLTINVIDGAGNPINGATVTLEPVGISSSGVLTSSSYSFNNLTDGKYHLSVVLPGYRTYSANIDIPYTGASPFPVTLWPSDDALNLASIPAGTFNMGSLGPTGPSGPFNNELPQHQVTLTKDFYMGKYEVTNEEYVKFLNAQTVPIDPNWLRIPSAPPADANSCGLTGDLNTPSGIKVKNGYEKRPVVWVTWYGAIEYCNWLSNQYGFTRVYTDPNENPANWITRDGYRLPTEAEWEYACRAGTGSLYYWGDDSTLIGSYAWYNDGVNDNLQNVGMKLSNNFGLYDMSGNVWEWCSDWYVANYYSTGGPPWNNPTGPVSGSLHLMRGGGWSNTADRCRSAFRLYVYSLDYCTVNLGFRLVRNH